MKPKQITMDEFGKTNIFPKYPEYDKTLWKRIRTLSEVVDDMPKYKVTFKMPVFGGYIQKICIYLGYWHSMDGWNYDKHEAKEWQEVKWEKWMEYRWKGEEN